MTEQQPSADVQTEPVYKYDMAVSFAGEQRAYVEEVVRGLKLPKDRIFYDADYKAELLGEDLAEVFTKLYRDEARYVAMFISREYAEKEWCRVERRAALRRRMMTKGAYILPIRLDTTKLDDVEGLLGTIGDLDGLREGVPGVTEVLRQKLALVLAAADTADDDKPKFGQIVHDAAGLTELAQTRPHSWQWAAFGSVLVQRREAVKDQIRDHSLGFAPLNGQRITEIGELVQLVKNSLHDVEQNGQQLVNLVKTPAFRMAFGAPHELSDDPEVILHVASRVMDHYERYLQLARRVRGTAAPSDYINILDSCARLSDMPMAGMNEFIDLYVEAVEEMPERLIAAGGADIDLPVKLPIHIDRELCEQVVEQLKQILADAAAEDDDD